MMAVAKNKIRNALDYWYAEALKGYFYGGMESKDDMISLLLVDVNRETNDRILEMCYNVCYNEKTLICKFVISRETHMAVAHNIGMVLKLFSRVVYETAKK